jgi:DNA-binding PadR family transcriptional regulator
MREGTLESPGVPWTVPLLLLLVRGRGSYGQDLTRSIIDLLGATRPRTVYRTLRHLAQEGMVICECDVFDCRLSRRRYSITELDEAYLESYANPLTENRELMDFFLDTYA